MKTMKKTELLRNGKDVKIKGNSSMVPNLKVCLVQREGTRGGDVPPRF